MPPEHLAFFEDLKSFWRTPDGVCGHPQIIASRVCVSTDPRRGSRPPAICVESRIVPTRLSATVDMTHEIGTAMGSKTFRPKIVREGSMCFIPLTFDPKDVFGKVRAPVKVTLNGSWTVGLTLSTQ